MMRRFLFLLAVAAAAFAQTASVAFDVVSIHPAAVAIRDPHAFPIHFSPTSVTMRSVTLAGAIAWSWSVMENQVKGPGWLDGDQYDVAAKTSTAHSEDELRHMFQAVLAERFGVSVHRERKEMQAYILARELHGSTGAGSSGTASNRAPPASLSALDASRATPPPSPSSAMPSPKPTSTSKP